MSFFAESNLISLILQNSQIFEAFILVFNLKSDMEVTVLPANFSQGVCKLC